MNPFELIVWLLLAGMSIVVLACLLQALWARRVANLDSRLSEGRGCLLTLEHLAASGAGPAVLAKPLAQLRDRA